METDNSPNPLHLDISPMVNVDGNHVIRWCETRSWGVMTYLITIAKPYELDRVRRDFDLFALVPTDRRNDAANAVRRTMTPAAEILAAFLPKIKEESVLAQQSLF